MEMITKLSFFVILLCILISLKNHNAKIKNTATSSSTGNPRVVDYDTSSPTTVQVVEYATSSSTGLAREMESSTSSSSASSVRAVGSATSSSMGRARVIESYATSSPTTVQVVEYATSTSTGLAREMESAASSSSASSARAVGSATSSSMGRARVIEYYATSSSTGGRERVRESEAATSSSMSVARPMRRFQVFGNGGSSVLKYDFYGETCPEAEEIVRSKVRELAGARREAAPQLLRLVFHDCFIEGCDASVLLDSTNEFVSEKESPPNETLKGFDIIDIIKSDLEEACPGIVSCSDTLVLAARESVLLGGGPFYPLKTGRRDSNISHSDIATSELPSPHDTLSKAVAAFASRGFSERETVSLLGAHSIGTIHCKFILNRLYNFSGTDEPDPTLDSAFVNDLRLKCNTTNTSLSPSPSPSPSSPSPSPSLSQSFANFSNSTLSSHNFSSPQLSLSPIEPKVDMDTDGKESGFGTIYYRSLLQARGILYVDQQLTVGEETEAWVQAYASDVSLFRKDFALAMMKLSDLRVLTSPMGHVRRICSKVA